MMYSNNRHSTHCCFDFAKHISRLFPLWATIFLLLFVAYYKLACAADQGDNIPFTEENFLSDIPVVLSASRMPQRSIEAPASISVVDQDMIQASGAMEIADLLRLVPGIQVGHINGNTFAVTYHGLAYDYPRKLQVLIDGRSVYRPLLSNVDWANLGIAISDIERIEVIRGPNTPTYGANAFFGTINIITKQHFHEQGEQFKTIVGSQHTSITTGRYWSSTSSFDFRSTIGYRRDDGFDSANDGRKIAMSSFRSIHNLDALNTLDIQLGFSGGDMGAGGDGSVFNPVRNKRITSNYGLLRWTNTQSDKQEYHLQLYHNYYRQEDRFLIGPLSSLLDGVDPGDIPGLFNGQPDQSVEFGIFDGQAERTDIEFQHRFQPFRNLRIVWGGSARRDTIKGHALLDKSGIVEDRSQRIFANTELYITEKTIFNAGVMVEDNDIVGTHTSPRLALNYLLTNYQVVRISATKAYRSPSLFEANNRSVVRFNDGRLLRVFYDHDEKLEAEKLVSYEIGYSLDLPNLNILYDLKIFREQLSNVIAAPYDSSYGQTEIALDDSRQDRRVWTNDGYVNTHGFEMQLRFHFDKLTQFIANYAHTDAEGIRVTERSPRQEKNAGKTVPRHTVNLMLTKRLYQDWSASLVYYRLSGMDWSANDDKIDAYKRWDFKVVKEISLSNINGSFSLIVHNMFNEKYSEFRRENVFDRRIYLQLSFKY